jgi:RND family efflux transporter MFP subunit
MNHERDPRKRGRGTSARMLAKSGVSALVAASLLAGCGASRHSESGAAQGALAVATLTFAPEAAAGLLELPGRVKATEEVTLTARLPARLTALVRREGERVRRGEVLARFEAPETRGALAAARAEHEAAELALEVALRQEARVESLWSARVVSRRERELAESDRRTAEARRATARAAREQLESGVLVRAPFDGRVVRRHADPGADLAAGSPLLDLRSESGNEVVVDVPEGALVLLESGTIHVRLGETWVETPLARLDGMTDWRTRTRTAHLRVPGAAEPGAYVRVRLAARGAGDGAAASLAGAVPESSLVRRGALAGVFVLDDGAARLRWLKLGRAEAGRVEVLAGLFRGDVVALEPGALTDGRPATPRP